MQISFGWMNELVENNAVKQTLTQNMNCMHTLLCVCVCCLYVLSLFFGWLIRLYFSFRAHTHTLTHNTHHHRINKNNLQSNLSCARFNIRILQCSFFFWNICRRKWAQYTWPIKIEERIEKELKKAHRAKHSHSHRHTERKKNQYT